MRRWLVLSALALPLLGGCKSISHPVVKSQEAREAERKAEEGKPKVPNGENSPFGPS